jgi:hypothetical protein
MEQILAAMHCKAARDDAELCGSVADVRKKKAAV